MTLQIQIILLTLILAAHCNTCYKRLAYDLNDLNEKTYSNWFGLKKAQSPCYTYRSGHMISRHVAVNNQCTNAQIQANKTVFLNLEELKRAIRMSNTNCDTADSSWRKDIEISTESNYIRGLDCKTGKRMKFYKYFVQFDRAVLISNNHQKKIVKDETTVEFCYSQGRQFHQSYKLSQLTTVLTIYPMGKFSFPDNSPINPVIPKPQPPIVIPSTPKNPEIVNPANPEIVNPANPEIVNPANPEPEIVNPSLPSKEPEINIPAEEVNLPAKEDLAGNVLSFFIEITIILILILICYGLMKAKRQGKSAQLNEEIVVDQIQKLDQIKEIQLEAINQENQIKSN